MEQDVKDYKSLIDSAKKAQQQAYAPYSKFAVGAAIQCKSGATYTGCNIENVSFALTLCAERAAVASAIVSGSRDFVALAVATNSKRPAVPCGACRQVLAEFNPRLKIVSVTAGGEVEEFDLAKLLPSANQGILDTQSDV